MELIKSIPVLCIDPGTTHSGVVVFDGLNVLRCESEIPNISLLNLISGETIRGIGIQSMAIEMFASYGMPIGKSSIETILWTGRFMERFGFDQCTKIYRKDVKMFLCNSMRAKDTNIRQAILDLFPATGGGKTPQTGTKGQPGPLYGVTSHAMSALAVGLTYRYSK